MSDMAWRQQWFAQYANLEVKLLVKCKNSLGGRAVYGITSAMLGIFE